MNKLFLSLSLLAIVSPVLAVDTKAVLPVAPVVVPVNAQLSKAERVKAAISTACKNSAEFCKSNAESAKSNMWDKSLTIRGTEFKHGRKVATIGGVITLGALTYMAYKRGVFGKAKQAVKSLFTKKAAGKSAPRKPGAKPGSKSAAAPVTPGRWAHKG
jgi:hypothetical protein